MSAYSHRDEPLRLAARYHKDNTSWGDIRDDEEYGTKDNGMLENRHREV
ncbi:hypothetical protein [Paenibacillus popilliae]|nr:hypothetical protein [Paenibacillus sp. SDF0028]